MSHGATGGAGAEELERLCGDRGSLGALRRLVCAVPDDYAAWHRLSAARDGDFLALNARALAGNAKAYAAWHHRLVAVRAGATAAVLRDEDRLTRLLLGHDPRNFHAWAHRRRLGLGAIRDVFNASALHDLVARGEAPDAAALVATDPGFEGGHHLRRLCREGGAHVKVFARHAVLCFAAPFAGRAVLGGEVRDLPHPVLQCRFAWAGPGLPRVAVGGAALAAREVPDDGLDLLLGTDPGCVFLCLAKLRASADADAAPWVARLCGLDPGRAAWYRSRAGRGFRVFALHPAGEGGEGEGRD